MATQCRRQLHRALASSPAATSTYYGGLVCSQAPIEIRTRAALNWFRFCMDIYVADGAGVHRRGSLSIFSCGIHMLKIAAYTGGISVASARFRVRQYVGPLRDRGISIIENTALFCSFPPTQKLVRPFWAAGSLLQRVPGVIRY